MNKFILIMLFSTLISIFISNFLFNIFNIIVWSIALIFMFVNGIYFTFKLKFIQFRFIKQLKAIKPSKKDGVSSFESLSMSLASRVGVGSIAGIALAIYLGGAGVVFWMWVSGLIISANTYVESVYGSLYKEKVSNNIYVGGPSYYIKKGLSNNKLAIIYALLIIISYMAGFLTIQSNTIVNAVGVFNINHLVTISIVCILTSLIIFRDVKFLAKFSSTWKQYVSKVNVPTFIAVVNKPNKIYNITSFVRTLDKNLLASNFFTKEFSFRLLLSLAELSLVLRFFCLTFSNLLLLLSLLLFSLFFIRTPFYYYIYYSNKKCTILKIVHSMVWQGY